MSEYAYERIISEADVDKRDAEIARLQSQIDTLNKDNERLLDILTKIQDASDPDDGESYRGDDPEGCLDFVHYSARDLLREIAAEASAEAGQKGAEDGQ